MVSNFKTTDNPNTSHAARLAWLASLEPDALRDVLILAMRRAESEHAAQRAGLAAPGPLAAEWCDACGDLAEFLQALCED